MIDAQTCNAARATLGDAMAQLLEVGHALVVDASAARPAREIEAVTEDIGVLARALQVFERLRDDR